MTADQRPIEIVEVIHHDPDCRHQPGAELPSPGCGAEPRSSGLRESELRRSLRAARELIHTGHLIAAQTELAVIERVLEADDRERLPEGVELALYGLATIVRGKLDTLRPRASFLLGSGMGDDLRALNRAQCVEFVERLAYIVDGLTAVTRG